MAEKLSPERRRELKRRRQRFGLLEDWYGTETAQTEMAAHTSSPQPIGRSVERLLRNLNSSEINNFITIDTRWNELVGAAFSRLAKPERLTGTTLVLEVRHSALLAELRPSLDLIRQRLTAELGPGIVNEIRLTIAGGR